MGERRATGSSHALVIGGGFAGLLSARVLSDWFGRVTVLERDALPVAPEPRAGTPQARHAHALLAGGHRVLEGLFPGLTASLVGRGVAIVDWGRDFAVHTRVGWMPASRVGLETLGCGRDLLEWEIRRRVVENCRIEVRTGVRVRALLHDDARERVHGVRCVDGGEGRDIEADFVVDATGRTSRTPDWLEAAGYGVPEQTTVVSQRAYASRIYRQSPAFRPPWRALLQSTWSPDNPRGGVIYPMEDASWQVTLVGAAGEQPPLDEEGYLRYARNQRSEELYRALSHAEPVGTIRGWRRTENRLRHFERMPRWPAGLVVVGDAVCALNPVFAQGMTASAIGVAALAAELRAYRPFDARRFQRRLGRLLAQPFFLATCEDLRWACTRGAEPSLRTRFVQWYLDAVTTAAADHPEIYRAHMAVWHMESSLATLFRPVVALRALKAVMGAS